MNQRRKIRRMYDEQSNRGEQRARDNHQLFHSILTLSPSASTELLFL